MTAKATFLIHLTMLISAVVSPAQSAERILVFAAASMNEAVTEIGAQWTQESGTPVTVSSAASSILARQITAGAPAHIYISANDTWMDDLVTKSFIIPASVTTIASNRLVIIGHGKNAEPIDVRQLPELLANTRLAIGITGSVPAGMYGKAALTNLGVWDDVAQRIAETDNVRAALQLVANGDAHYGVVYQTDTKLSDDVSITLVFPLDSHPSITYRAGLVDSAQLTSEAAAFLAFLESPEAQAILSSHGFLTSVIEK